MSCAGVWTGAYQTLPLPMESGLETAAPPSRGHVCLGKVPIPWPRPFLLLWSESFSVPKPAPPAFGLACVGGCGAPELLLSWPNSPRDGLVKLASRAAEPGLAHSGFLIPELHSGAFLLKKGGAG